MTNGSGENPSVWSRPRWPDVFISEPSQSQNTWVTSIQMRSGTSWNCSICEYRPVRVKNIFSIYSCVFVFFKVNLESKMGHEWQDCPLTNPHMSADIFFLMRTHPLKEEKASCSTLKTCHKRSHIILNNTFVAEKQPLRTLSGIHKASYSCRLQSLWLALSQLLLFGLSQMSEK